MSLSVDTTFQNSVARRLWNTDYASLETYQSNLVGDIGAQVLTRLKEYAEFLSMPASGNAAPDEWQPWFITEAVLEIAATTHPQKFKEFRMIRDIAMQTAMSAFSRTLNDYDPSSNTEAFAFAWQNLRYFIVNHTVRQKPPLMPPFESVDAAIDWALKWCWNKGPWTYRRRQVTATISALGAVSFDLAAGEVFDSLASFNLYYTDEPWSAVPIRWADADTMAEAKSWDGTTTGRPTLYRIQTTGSTPAWLFSPAPDAAYTARCEVLVRAPADPDSATDTAPFDAFAAEHIQNLRDLALAKLLYDHNVPDPATARAKFDEVCGRCDQDFAKYQNVSEGDGRGTVGDVMQDWAALPSGTIYGTGM